MPSPGSPAGRRRASREDPRPGVRGALGVDPRPVPELHVQEGPELPRRVPLPGHVRADERPHRLRAKEAPGLRPLPQEEVLDVCAQGAAEPRREGDEESDLPVLEHRAGEEPFRVGAGDPLQRERPDLEPPGDPRRQLRDPMVEDRHAVLEGVCHRHPVLVVNNGGN